MDDEFEIKLNANPTETGFEILPINAGEAKGHGITFSVAVLKASLNLWDNLPCFLDHDYSGMQSVKNLAGAETQLPSSVKRKWPSWRSWPGLRMRTA
jgi:hypothetical protein